MKTVIFLLSFLYGQSALFAQWTYERRDGTKFYDTIYVKKVKDNEQYKADNFPLFRNEVKLFIAGARNKWPNFDSCLYVVNMYNPGKKERAFCFTITYIFQLHYPHRGLQRDSLAYSDVYNSARYMLKIDSDVVLFNKGETYIRQWVERKQITVIDSNQRRRMIKKLIVGQELFNDWGGPAFFYYWFDGSVIKRKGTFKGLGLQSLILYFQDKNGNQVSRNPNEFSYDNPSINFNEGSPEKEID